MHVLERPIAAQRDMTMILAALAALKKGDGSVRLPAEWTGLPGKVAEAFNDVVELNQRMACPRGTRRFANHPRGGQCHGDGASLSIRVSVRDFC